VEKMTSSEPSQHQSESWYERFSRLVGKGLLFDVVDGSRVSVDALMYHLTKFYVKGFYKSLADPTCGTENHSYGKLAGVLESWGIRYLPCDADPGNWACRSGYPRCICDVFEPSTLPVAEAWFYDPPFTPRPSSKDPRRDDYSVAERAVGDIKRYYSRAVFEGFIERGAKLIIVKGASFYYPPKSENLFLLEKDIVEPAREMKLIGRIVYRYSHGRVGAMNALLASSLEPGVRRLHNISTTFLIFRVMK